VLFEITGISPDLDLERLNRLERLAASFLQAANPNATDIHIGFNFDEQTDGAIVIRPQEEGRVYRIASPKISTQKPSESTLFRTPEDEHLSRQHGDLL
jgi:hypothetical protein